ncbi:MAG: trigger factor [Rhodospirillaceae bacterium]|jgi:trigger factor|nr:trigger factor [Rhodospirillaceae bacterium]MBT5374309.1 trigger factor [Rhodospirillaceae bacterium]MBT5751297.1 trigger factor [Rhodospirillaceae bacterium]
MQVSETKSEGLVREFKVIVPAGDIELELTNRLTEIGKTAKIPGFRPGKVPMTLLKQRYGSSVMGEILESTVNVSSQKAIQEKNLRPAIQPKIEITSYEDGKDLEYSMSLELMPEIPEIDLASLEIERVFTEVEEPQIAQALKDLAESHKRFKALDKPRKLQQGDLVRFDFVGKIDGVAFDGGTGSDEEIEIGSGRFIPGYEEQMIGLSVGDEHLVKVPFPDDYREKSVAGKLAEFDVTIKEIKGPAEVAVDDELAKDMGLENLDTLKKALSHKMESDLQQVARVRLRREVADVLEDKCDFTPPQSMVDQEFEGMWERYQHQKQDHVHDENCDHGGDDENEDEKRNEFKETANRRIMLAILLAEIGRLNNVLLDESEVAKSVQREAAAYPGQENQVIAYYEKNQELMNGLRAQVYEEQVLTYILEMAKVTDKKITLEELTKSPDAAAKPAKKGAKKKPDAQSKAKPKAEKKAVKPKAEPKATKAKADKAKK